VKKLQWAPSLIHCHSWFSSLLPVYIKKVYHDDPLFKNSRIILSIYDNEFPKPLNKALRKKLIQDDIPEKDLTIIDNPTYINLYQLAIDMSDGIILGSQSVNADVISYVKKSGKPMLTYQSSENYIDVYSDFYDQILDAG
ncbi:MAG: glycogen/starch synthase, partial [Bacteroidales bacterium]|nr:glycogen/starch synthase [Bacteroidales bacterium]